MASPDPSLGQGNADVVDAVPNGESAAHSGRPSNPLTALSLSTRALWQRVQLQYLQERETGAWVNLSYIFSGYRSSEFVQNLSHFFLGVFVVVSFATIYEAYYSAPALSLLGGKYQYNVIELAITFLFLILSGVVYLTWRRKPVYLLDFATFIPPERLKVSKETFLRLTEEANCFTPESIEFQKRILERASVGDCTYFPEAMFRAKEIGANGGRGDRVLNMASARREAEMVLFTTVGELLRSTKTNPKAIDILIVNCSLFNPTPSLTSMIVNHFKMKSSILTYNLSGMGCSAGLISIDLAKDLLQCHRNALCLVVSTENITQNWYLGQERSMLITNTLFRLGGAAVLLSNRLSDSRRAKYALLHTVRTHRGADDLAYRCIFQEEDEKGIRGVRLSKHIMEIAGETLRENIFRLGPLVFPLDVHIRFFVNLARRRYLGQKHVKSYVPDFHRAFEHFCIHTGGRAVIDTIEASLRLTPEDVEPSRYALYRFGNTSSASIWYELQFIERSGKMRRGDRTWQIAFGSGFKCNSAVWKCLRNISEREVAAEAVGT
jgi:3-ketoacyl-CoA synthase